MSRRYKYETTFQWRGRRIHIYGNTLAEIAAKTAAKKEKLKNEPLDDSGLTVEEWGYDCIARYKSGQSSITQAKFIAKIEKRVFAAIGPKRMSAVTPADLQEILNGMSGLSRAYINDIYHALRFLFGRAVIDGVIAKDPSLSISRPKGTYTPRRALTSEERDVVLSVALSERKYYGYALMLLCGCRTSEAARATGADVQKENGYNVLHIRGTKTDNADRIVPIPDVLYVKIAGTPRNEPIALYPSGRRIDDGNGSHLWSGFLHKCNVACGATMYRNKIIEPVISGIVPYCLRHEYCSQLARSGVDLRVAQRLMGHSSVTLTANIYTHVANDQVYAVAELIGASKS